MNIAKETIITDTDERSCIYCKSEFTTSELIEDPGFWHVTPDFKIECDACVEGQREYAQHLVFDETYGEWNRR